MSRLRRRPSRRTFIRTRPASSVFSSIYSVALAQVKRASNFGVVSYTSCCSAHTRGPDELCAPASAGFPQPIDFIGKIMSRKGAYIGGSTVVQLGSVGGPERPKHVEESTSAAFPRVGGAKVDVPKTKPPTKPRMAHPTFKKFRRRANDVMGLQPYVEDRHRPTARALARIQRRVEEMAALEYNDDMAAEAADLAKRFYDLKAKLGDAAIAKAKFAEREAKRSTSKDDSI